jgi:predicted transcriptional regulator
MRALLPLLPCLLLSLVAGAAAAVGDQVLQETGGVDPGLLGGGGAPSRPGGNGGAPVSAPPGLDLGPVTFTPDMGLGLAVGIGASLVGLAAASLLGTRFVNSENVLENDARRSIFEYIKTNPGCHLRETAGALQLSTTNVLWHLRKLEESNLVNSKKLEGYKVFYPVEGGVEAKRMGLALAVLRNPNARQILGIIARAPGVHQREIARMLSVNHGTVRWHLKKLGIVQLVLEVRKGAVSMYYVSALGLQALERVELRAAQVAQPPAMAEPLAPAAVVTSGPADVEF